jgi:hypothetical protein
MRIQITAILVTACLVGCAETGAETAATAESALSQPYFSHYSAGGLVLSEVLLLPATGPYMETYTGDADQFWWVRERVPWYYTLQNGFSGYCLTWVGSTTVETRPCSYPIPDSQMWLMDAGQIGFVQWSNLGAASSRLPSGLTMSGKHVILSTIGTKWGAWI